MITILWYYGESVYWASISPLSDKNPLSFGIVSICSITNAFTRSKRPILGYTLEVRQFWSCWFQIWFHIFTEIILSNANAATRHPSLERAKKKHIMEVARKNAVNGLFVIIRVRHTFFCPRRNTILTRTIFEGGWVSSLLLSLSTLLKMG